MKDELTSSKKYSINCFSTCLQAGTKTLSGGINWSLFSGVSCVKLRIFFEWRRECIDLIIVKGEVVSLSDFSPEAAPFNDSLVKCTVIETNGEQIQLWVCLCVYVFYLLSFLQDAPSVHAAVTPLTGPSQTPPAFAASDDPSVPDDLARFLN